jgi:hypothetical protein
MEQTLLKVKNLEKFVERHGEDTFISQTISKMLAYKAQNYNMEIERLNRKLKKFEQTYEKDSQVFSEEFKDGKLGDQMDFIEWSSLYQIRNSLLEKEKELQGII